MPEYPQFRICGAKGEMITCELTLAEGIATTHVRRREDLEKGVDGVLGSTFITLRGEARKTMAAQIKAQLEHHLELEESNKSCCVSRAFPADFDDGYVILQGGADILRNAVPRDSPIRFALHASVPCVFSEKSPSVKHPFELDGKVIELTLSDGSKVKLADFSQTTFELRGKGSATTPQEFVKLCKKHLKV